MNERKRTVKEPEEVVSSIVLPRVIHLVPMDNIGGFDVRPGFY